MSRAHLAPREISTHTAPGEVDSIDGFVMVLSLWAVRNLRFDESLGKLHGYDFDICMQAKAATRRWWPPIRASPPLGRADQGPGGWIAPTSHWWRSGTACFRTRARRRRGGPCAPRPRLPARGRSWSPTSTGRRRSSARSTGRNIALEDVRERLGAIARELETANESLGASSRRARRGRRRSSTTSCRPGLAGDRAAARAVASSAFTV